MAGLRGPVVDLELGNTPERPSPAAIRGSGYTSLQAEDPDRHTAPLNTTSDVPPPSYQSGRPSSRDRDANAPQVYHPPQTSSPFIPPATKHYTAQPPVYRDPFLNPATIKPTNRNIGYTNNDYGTSSSGGGQQRKNNECRNILIGLAAVHFIVGIVIIVVKVSNINNNR